MYKRERKNIAKVHRPAHRQPAAGYAPSFYMIIHLPLAERGVKHPHKLKYPHHAHPPLREETVKIHVPVIGADKEKTWRPVEHCPGLGLPVAESADVPRPRGYEFEAHQT